MRILKKGASTAVLVAFACPAAAQAQALPNGNQAAVVEDEGSADIIVTARRREEKLQDVPIAVTAVSAAALESRGLDSVTQVSQVAPNLQFTPGQGGNSGGISAFIRGIGENDYIITSDPAVAVYIDGVYVARSFGATTELLGVVSRCCADHRVRCSARTPSAARSTSYRPSRARRRARKRICAMVRTTLFAPVRSSKRR